MEGHGTCHHKLIYWIQGNFGIEGFVMKFWCPKTLFGIRDEPRGTKAHWINPWQKIFTP